MTRKKDPEIQENTDSGKEDNENDSTSVDERNNNYIQDEGTNTSGTIKNANATGLGAIGRNDQKQTDDFSNDPEHTGKD